MNIDPWILAFSAVTVFATIFMGFWSARRSKTASDFFVAGRSVSVGMNASAISGEYLSAASFMGVAGMVMSSGYDALWYPVCYACGYLFLLLFIAGPLRRFGAYTIPDFAEGRFDSPVFRKIAVVFVLFIGFFYTMPQMKGAGTTLAYIFPGLPYWAGVVLVGAVITLNVALGGMKGITLVQAFQYWAKMFAISVPIFVLMAVYGHYGKQIQINSRVARNLNQLPSLSMRAGTDTPQYFPRKLSLEEAVNEYVNLTGRKRLFSGSILLDRLDGLLGGRLTAHHLLRGSLLPTIQLDFTKPFDLTAGEDTPNSMKPFEVGMTLGQAVGANITSLGGNPTLEDSARALAQVMVLVSRSERVSDLRKALNDHEVELVPVGNDYIFARMREREIIRQPLPEKAPADSTWLSPFGPLTTKAAKAAEAKLKADSIDEVFEELDYSIKNTGNLAANALAAAQTKANNFLEKHVANPQLAFGKHSLGEMLIELRKARKKSVLISATLMKNAGGWVTNEATLTTTTDGRTKEIEAGFTNANIGLILANEATLVFPLPRKTEFQKIYDSKGIVPFKNGPPDEKVLKVRQKNYSLLYTYSLIIALVCGTAGLPHILVRFYTNPDGVAAKRTTMWVMILIGVFYVFPPVFGVLGRNLMPELYNGLTGVKGTDGIVLKLPTILREKYGVLGSILSGVTCAGAFAAFMSTFSGLLVSMTGALAHDVYGRMLNPKATPAQRLRMFKLAAVLIGGVAIVLGSFVEPLEINFMVGQAFAIAAASYFPLLFMSVWWRGMTMRGAAIGMLSGGLCALAAVTLTNVSNLALDKGPMGKIFAGFAPMNQFWAGHPLLRILCEQPAIWTVPLAIGLMIVVSKATRRSVPGDIRMKMLVLHAPEKLGLKQEYIQEHQHGH